jgi:hypothetical protein
LLWTERSRQGFDNPLAKPTIGLMESVLHSITVSFWKKFGKLEVTNVILIYGTYPLIVGRSNCSAKVVCGIWILLPK